jgi:hypothetical protein|tara:strand:- start:6669 stop:6863 length:195 start_codon:yes stop_codon:yes gene_type:complete
MDAEKSHADVLASIHQRPSGAELVLLVVCARVWIGRIPFFVQLFAADKAVILDSFCCKIWSQTD